MARNDNPRAADAASDATGTRSVAHGEFHLERVYDWPVAHVWEALTDPKAKSKWFAGPSRGWELLDRQMDIRVGGRERLRGRRDTGVVKLQSTGRGTRLKVTEQGAFLDGDEDAGARERGTAQLLDALGSSLAS